MWVDFTSFCVTDSKTLEALLEGWAQKFPMFFITLKSLRADEAILSSAKGLESMINACLDKSNKLSIHYKVNSMFELFRLLTLLARTSCILEEVDKAQPLPETSEGGSDSFPSMVMVGSRVVAEYSKEFQDDYLALVFSSSDQIRRHIQVLQNMLDNGHLVNTCVVESKISEEDQKKYASSIRARLEEWKKEGRL